MDGFGNTNYEAYLANGDDLPFWITFLPSQRTFIINELDKNEIESLDIKVTAKNIHNKINNTSATGSVRNCRNKSCVNVCLAGRRSSAAVGSA